MAFVVLDRPRGSHASPLESPLWQTCLREVAFRDGDVAFRDGDVAFRDGDVACRDGNATTEALVGSAAYGRVLEIICGLRSPLVGETQVLGQFKTFLMSLGPDERWLASIGRRLLTDAKAIRRRHLHHLGSRTYGSAVRRHVANCDRVALVGTGALATEVLPFVARDRHVDVFTRRLSSFHTALSRVTAHHLGTPGSPLTDPSVTVAIVVAAPAEAADLEMVAARYGRVDRVVDLRADSAPWSADARTPVVTLTDLFDDISRNERANVEHVAAALADIVQCSRAFDAAEQVRPFGWDDLCA